MTDFLTEVATEKQFTGNVVILVAGQYFAIRQPDSGLTIQSPHRNCIESLMLNPTQIDVERVSTSIASYSFRLTDLQNVVTKMVGGDAQSLLGQAVRIWLGRSDTGMAFSDYYELPTTKVDGLSHSDNSYDISVVESTQRIDKPIYDVTAALAGDILAATTEITMRDDLSDFPASGVVKCEDEFITFASIDTVNNRLSGCTRGLLDSVAVDHAANADCKLVETVTGNPLTIILKILISGGGGGTYDTLQSGCAISQSLVDVAGIELLRDTYFPTHSYTLSLYDIASALTFIENELLLPNNLRFSFTEGSSSKLTLVLLDKAVFQDDANTITEDTLTDPPEWNVDLSQIYNVIKISWDFNEGSQMFQAFNTYTDADSILAYGAQAPLELEFKGIKAASDGQTLVDYIANRLLGRLANPTPTLDVQMQLDKSIKNIGERVYLESQTVPALDGTLNFANSVEILSRSINYQTGDVSEKLAFTSFTAIRSCFLAPSDLIQTVVSQKIVTVGSGRGSYYSVGFAMRLWDVTAGDYVADAVNYITGITGDQITFRDNWTTVLSAPNLYRLKFADYDDCTTEQKRYCFLSDDGAIFSDGKQTYKVTY